jgi:hypothetical protein
MEKLKKMRKAGLEEEGEFSIENLAFKLLRNHGYIEKLVNIKTNSLTKELSLENVSVYDPDLDKSHIKNIENA